MIRPIIAAVGSAFSYFREAILTARIGSGQAVAPREANPWVRPEIFNPRYELLWALYCNTALKVGAHAWSQSWKAANGIGKGARHLLGPFHELVEFWVDHIWGGSIDPDAGDGSKVASAIPIETRIEALRPPIAAILQASNWQVNKDICTRHGAALGDTFIRVDDDPGHATTRLEVVYPGEVWHAPRDRRGNVKSYDVRRWVEDPEGGPNQAQYRETCDRDGSDVVFRTYRNGKPYPWNGVAAEWREPYGFVPLVQIQHTSIGLERGCNAWHSAEARFIEPDDQASSLSDGIRRANKSPVLIAGMDGPPVLEAESEAPAEARRARVGAMASIENAARSMIQFIWHSKPDTRVHQLTTPPDSIGITGYIRLLLERLDRSFPELVADAGIGGGITAEAVRNARQKTTDKVQNVRIGYDDGLRRALQMAIAIAGFRRYPGFEGYGLDSFAAGDLAFRIGHRDVFKADPRDELADDAAFWTAAKTARESGYPLSLYLEDAGWDPGRIARVVAAEGANAQAAAKLAGTITTPAVTGPNS